MSKLRNIDKLFEGRHFDREVIVLCVRWYLRYKLSFRELVEIMAERGLPRAHTTGCNASRRSSASAGTGCEARWSFMESQRDVRESPWQNGSIFTVRLTSQERRSTSGSAPGAMSLRPRLSS
jgi:hypothetical protein